MDRVITKVSVIIPIYKVEKFIGRCVRSLMEQTLCDVEYIFVNDATPDSSMEVLASVMTCYPDKKDCIKILNHEENKGLPAARNTGLAVAVGNYIFHCDSDDFVEADMLEELYVRAQKIDADIVWCDWFLTFETNERYMKQPSYATSIEALKAMLGGAMKYNVWNKLVKRSLYVENDIAFPAGHGMGEDMTMMLLFALARKVAYLPKAFYHYVKLNTYAFSQTYSDKHLEELQYNVRNIELKLELLFGTALEQEISFLKLEAKFPFLLSCDTHKQKLWREWYPEANKYILKNRNISTRSRIIQWCAWKRLNGIIFLYRWFLNRIIYGIIYK